MLWMWSWCRLSGLSVSLGVLLLDGMSRREGAYWAFLAPPSPTKEQAMHTTCPSLAIGLPLSSQCTLPPSH